MNFFDTIKAFFQKLFKKPSPVVKPAPAVPPAVVIQKPLPPEPPKKLLLHPYADGQVIHKVKGKYPNNYPKGVIVHYTAGECDNEEDMIETLHWVKEMGYATWGIGPTGKIYQTHSLDSWGYHAGESKWPGLGTGVSSQLLGIEIACAGKTDAAGKSWEGKVYPRDRLRTGPLKHNCEGGTYVKYTEAQEKALIELCLWLKRNNPECFDFKYVLGHDSVSPGRKADPGWSLSMTIPDLQAKLEQLYAAGK